MKGQISYNLQSDSMIIYKRLPKQPLKIVHSRPNFMYVKTFYSDLEGEFTRMWDFT